jgi:hypothetical protein
VRILRNMLSEVPYHIQTSCIWSWIVFNNSNNSSLKDQYNEALCRKLELSRVVLSSWLVAAELLSRRGRLKKKRMRRPLLYCKDCNKNLNLTG